MTMTILVGSIIGTIIIAVLSVMTLTEGYGFKHTIDPPANQEDSHETESINDTHKS